MTECSFADILPNRWQAGSLTLSGDGREIIARDATDGDIRVFRVNGCPVSAGPVPPPAAIGHGWDGYLARGLIYRK